MNETVASDDQEPEDFDLGREDEGSQLDEDDDVIIIKSFKPPWMQQMTRSQIEKYNKQQEDLIERLRRQNMDKEKLPVKLKLKFKNREGGIRIVFNQPLAVPQFI